MRSRASSVSPYARNESECIGRVPPAPTWTHDGCKLAFGEGSLNRPLAGSRLTLSYGSLALMRESCADSQRKRDCLARGANVIAKGVIHIGVRHKWGFLLMVTGPPTDGEELRWCYYIAA